MEYEIDPSANLIRIAVDGDLDAAMVQEMREAVEKVMGDARLVVIDLTNVDFIDSAGVGLIVRTYKSRQGAKQPMAIVGATGQPRELLGTTQIDRIIPFHDSLDEIAAQ